MPEPATTPRRLRSAPRAARPRRAATTARRTIDPMAGGGLELRREREPPDEGRARSDNGCDDADTTPLINTTRRKCLAVAPIAASMPSWRSRRCAITAKPAAATRQTRSRTNVESTSTRTAAVAFSACPRPGRRSLAPLGSLTLDKSCGAGQAGRSPTGVEHRAKAPEGRTRRRVRAGFSTMPTTVRSTCPRLSDAPT